MSAMSITKRIATIVGVFFLLAGLLGFAAPGVMGMHLTPLHNLIHILSGALALYFGLKGGDRAARMFCTIFGVVYASLGVIGFVAGRTGGVIELIPGHLMLGVADHIVHLIAGALFIFAGLYRRSFVAGPPVP